ncbi:NAD(P)-dependent oxidoreductase [Candidatus Woesebacteria bacterium]|nr:NAD(P)-dependent oxidoreductase [Candidatus Woesebacteria bacterium]
MKPVVAVTGGTGLVGSRFVADYADRYEFVSLDLNDPVNPIDITNIDQVKKLFVARQPATVVHFAAFTDVTAAWKQSNDTTGLVYKVNVTGTEVVARAAAEVNAHFIQISTAYIFDGNASEPYTETALPNPIEWYGRTKLLAEEAVQLISNKWTILRIDQPFRPDAFPKIDVAHRILKGLTDGSLYPQFADHYFGPTFIPDFAKIIDWVLRTGTSGIFHATSGEQWTDYAFAQAIATQAGFDPGTVKQGSLAQYLETSERPYQKNTALDTTKIAQLLDFKMNTITSALNSLQVPETVSASKAQQ